MNEANPSQPNRPRSKLSISLLQNGLHSLERGMESFGSMNSDSDPWCFKDGIMFIHHAVELLMKEILQRHSPFLVFEDLKDLTRKKKEADKASTDIFSLSKPPKTITYEEAVNRVDAFLGPQELTTDLLHRLNKLNSLRNQLEHYAIEADREEVITLLTEMKEPLLRLLDSTLGGVRESLNAKTKLIWNEVAEERASYSELEELVYRMLRGLKGKTIPSRLIHDITDLKLENDADIQLHYELPSTSKRRFQTDVLCITGGHRIVVEVKGAFFQTDQIIDKLDRLGQVFNAKAWLITSSPLSEASISRIVSPRRLVSGKQELDELVTLSTSPS